MGNELENQMMLRQPKLASGNLSSPLPKLRPPILRPHRFVQPKIRMPLQQPKGFGIKY